MKPTWAFLSALLGVCSGASGTEGLPEPRFERRFIPGAYIVEFTEQENANSFASSLASKAGLSGFKERFRFDSTLFSGASLDLGLKDGDVEEDALGRLRALPEIKNLWPVEVVPVPRLNLSWAANDNLDLPAARKQNKAKGYSPHVMTQVDKLHDAGFSGKDIRIGIVDTGIDYTHPVLGGCFGPGCLVEFGADLVGEGYDGSQPPNPDDDPFEECNGHGTHVAGIIAALENPLGFAGAAPRAKIGMYRAFSCSDSTTIDALMAATIRAYEDGSDIITGSVGQASGWSEHPFALLVSRIVSAGVICTFAAGNELGGTEGLFGAAAPSVGDGVISVSSFQNTHSPSYDTETGVVTEHVDTRMGGYISTFTSWGPTFDLKHKPELGAPGGNILSTLPLAMGGYAVASGTSMACPLMASIVALIAEARGTRDSALITRLLIATAKPGLHVRWADDGTLIYPGLGPVPQQGAGLVQAYDAVYSSVTVDTPRLTFNDTEHAVRDASIVVKNEGNTTVSYTVHHLPALTAETVWSGSIYRQSSPELSEAYAEMSFDPAELVLEPGQEAQITVSVTAPKDVDVSTLPIYSGWVSLNDTTEKNTPIVLPYVGAAGAMRKTTVLASGRIWLGRSDDPRFSRILNGTVFQIAAPADHPEWGREPLEMSDVILPVGVLPTQSIWLVMGSSETRLEIQRIRPSCTSPGPVQVDNGLGDETLGNIAGYPMTFQRPVSWMSEWDGRMADGSWVAPGHYRIIVYALRTFGRVDVEEDWDKFTSVDFKVRYVGP